jgi:hypothetical protein
VEPIENTNEAAKFMWEEFAELVESFRNEQDPEAVKRLGDQVGRMVFGD